MRLGDAFAQFIAGCVAGVILVGIAAIAVLILT